MWHLALSDSIDFAIFSIHENRFSTSRQTITGCLHIYCFIPHRQGECYNDGQLHYLSREIEVIA